MFTKSTDNNHGQLFSTVNHLQNCIFFLERKKFWFSFMIMLLWFKKLVLFFVALKSVQQSFCGGNGVTDIEDHLETEIEFTDPRSFKQFRYKTLSVRQFGFGSINYNHSGKIEVGGRLNWETFALRLGHHFTCIHFGI
jgi:hypothetical protein